jgi:Reverse transcriptase (RNA-dependent DNA polymerase)
VAYLSNGCQVGIFNGVLEEEIYIEQPPGYLKEDGEGKVLKLKKTLYGLKQAHRAWNTD